MLQYRKFRLLNGNGDYYDLTEKNKKVFANDPQGLGYSKTLSILRLGDESNVTYRLFDLNTISFEILFYDSTNASKYAQYNEFVTFLSYKPLYLLYQRPHSFDWYRRRIEPLGLSKTEVSREDSMLHCNFEVQCLSFWEDNKLNYIQTDNTGLEGGKVYPIEYPIIYGQDSISNLNLTAVGLLDSPIAITINGTVTDPQYILYDNNNAIYGRGKFIGTFDKVFVDSHEADQKIELIRNGTILDNPMGYQDLTIGSPNEIYVTFLKLKAGKSKISFIVDENFTGSVRVEWRNRYVTV